MSVSIRLARIGKKKAPFYRIVAVDKRKKRDGEYLENLGTYNPLTGEVIQFHAVQFQAWVDKGAIPSDTVLRIQKKHVKASAAPKTTASKTKEAVAPKVKETPVKAVKAATPEVKKEAKTEDK